MLSFIFAVLLLALALVTVVLRKTYYFVPSKELKRQAEAGDKLARTLYRAVAYGSSLRILLWAVIGLASAGGFVLLARIAPPWMGFLLVTILLWLAFSWLPNTRITSLGARSAAVATPAIAWLLNYLHPVLSRTASFAASRYTAQHTGLFERSDVLALLDQQSQQPDSRVTPEEIDLVKHVLSFGEYKVRDSLRPRSLVKTVAVGDAIGPVLLDELHASGQTSFPVKKSSKSATIVGALHLNDVGIKSTGTVQEYMTTGVTYINESDSLADALHVFYQTKRQLFVVVNNFEEYVGVISLEDVLHQLVGRPEPNETLGSHDDLMAVAARHPKKVTGVDEVPVEPSEAVPETIAETDSAAQAANAGADLTIVEAVPEEGPEPIDEASDSQHEGFAAVSFEATDEPDNNYKPLPPEAELIMEPVDTSDESLPEADLAEDDK